MRSSALFQQPKQPDQTQVPVLSGKEMLEQLAGENILFRVNYLYDNARAKRHIDAQVILQTLYHIGAELMNTGKAYSADVELPSVNPDEMDNKKCSPTSEQELFIHKLLMEKYHSMPASVVRNGRHSASNPLHALFVIRVGLDHIPPESIYLMFTALKIASHGMTMMPNKVSFPNGGEFLGDYAAVQILRGYILNHQNHYFNFLSRLDKAAVADDSNPFTSSYMCIANADATDQVNNILTEPVLRPTRLAPSLTM